MMHNLWATNIEDLRRAKYDKIVYKLIYGFQNVTSDFFFAFKLRMRKIWSADSANGKHAKYVLLVLGLNLYIIIRWKIEQSHELNAWKGFFTARRFSCLSFFFILTTWWDWFDDRMATIFSRISNQFKTHKMKMNRKIRLTIQFQCESERKRPLGKQEKKRIS